MTKGGCYTSPPSRTAMWPPMTFARWNFSMPTKVSPTRGRRGRAKKRRRISRSNNRSAPRGAASLMREFRKCRKLFAKLERLGRNPTKEIFR